MSIILHPDEWEPVSSSKIELKKSKNITLTNEIVKHIFANLGITETRHNSVYNEIFRSDKVLAFADEDGDHKESVYASEAKVGDKKFEIAVVKLNDEEAVIIVHLEGCPTYGCYFGDRCLIGVLASDHWLEGTMFIQASFLAGMEQLREVGTIFVPHENVRTLFDLLKKFLTFEATCD